MDRPEELESNNGLPQGGHGGESSPAETYAPEPTIAAPVGSGDPTAVADPFGPPSADVLAPSPPIQPPIRGDGEPVNPRLVLVLAGLILLIPLGLIALLSEIEGGTNTTAIVIDIGLGIALLAGVESVKVWVLLRAGIGTVIFGGVAIADGDWVIAGVTAGFAVPLFLLLIGAPSRPRVGIAIGVFVVSAAALTVAETGSDFINQLSVGDCFSGIDIEGFQGVVNRVPVIPCDEPHDFEVYAKSEHPGTGSYPGDLEIGVYSAQVCQDRYPSFAGVEYGESGLDFAAFTPTSRSWTLFDDREITCAVYALDGSPLVGTAAGRATEFLLGCWSGFPPFAFPTDCESLHDIELYALVFRGEPLGVSYPGTDVLEPWITSECERRFTDWVGRPWGESALDIFWSVPDETSWAEGNRTGLCGVYRIDGDKLVGTVRHSGI